MKLRQTWNLALLGILLAACGGGTTTPRVISVTIEAPSTTVTTGDTLELNATVQADPGVSQNETVTWSSSDDGIARVDSNGLVTGVAEGTATITARSQANISKSDSVEVTVTSLAANRRPVADAGLDQEVVVRNKDAVTLDGSDSYDPDGNPLSYSWTFLSRPEGSEAVIENADEVIASFVADVVGEFVATLTVSDGLLTASANTRVTATVQGDALLLHPGESVTGVDGVLIGAADGAFEGELEVFVERAHDPTHETPMPAGVEVMGGFYRVGATVTTLAPTEAPFVIGLPVPPGVDTEKLALAVLEPDWHGHLYDSDTLEASWAFVDGFFDAERSLLLGTLSQLADSGHTVVIVSADAFSTRPTGLPEDVSTAHFHPDQPSFKASCSPGFEEAAEDCDDTAQDAAAQALEDVYYEFTGLGFKEPRLYREPIAVGGNDLTIIYPGPYVIELRPCSEAAPPSGQYLPGSAKAWACIGSSGVTLRRGETIRHEFFHATQWAYAGAQQTIKWEKWWVEGQAALAQRSGATLTRSNRGVAPVDTGLLDLSYTTQDFWLYLGLRQTLGLEYLIPFLGSRATTEGADQTIQQDITISGKEASRPGWSAPPLAEQEPGRHRPVTVRQ